MRIVKLLSRFIICILCVFCISGVYGEENLPTEQDSIPEQIVDQEIISEQEQNSEQPTEQKKWLDTNDITTFNKNISKDFDKFEPKIDLNPDTFVPIEAKLGLMLMKALSVIDTVLQMSLVQFAIIFLLFMYIFWVGLEAYKLIRDSGDYKTALYNIFKQGLTIVIWVVILNYGPIKIFSMIVSPILELGTYLSDFILGAVAETYKVNIPDTCAAIHNYVNADKSLDLLVDADTAANIMCLPSRISIYFYHATATGFQWIKYGLGHSITMIVVGIVSIVIFVKCIFKYAFMALGIATSLFLTLMMLPFTALAESMPSNSEKNIAGQVFNGLLKVFNTQKLTSVLLVFVNAAVYFVSLSIVIAICAALLANIISLDSNGGYSVGSVITTILAGYLVLYFANQTDSLAKKIGGNVDNKYIKQFQDAAKTVWGNAKNLATKLAQTWIKK